VSPLLALGFAFFLPLLQLFVREAVQLRDAPVDDSFRYHLGLPTPATTTTISLAVTITTTVL
jgi:hypothetical protein